MSKRYKDQLDVEVEKFENKYSRTVMKDLKTKKTIKDLKLDNKAKFDTAMDKKKDKYEKVDVNKSNEQLRIKKRNHSLANEEKRMERQLSDKKVRMNS